MNEIDVSDIRSSDVGDLLGKFKKWQIVYFASIVYVYGVTSFSSLGVIFLAPSINFTCAVDGNVSDENDVEVAANECSYSVDNGSQMECAHWNYNRTFYHRTFTEEYNLICNREYLISLANSLQHVGDIAGSILLGHLADKFGRRRVILSAMWCGVVASLLSQFAPSFEFILVAKVLYGFSGVGLASVGFVLLMEITGIEYRGMLGIAVELGWVTCYVAIPGFSWLLRDSQYLQAVFTTAFCLLILLAFTVPESPRWLLLKNRNAEAAKVMNKALKMNGMPIVNMDEVVEKLSSVIKLSEDSNTSNSIIDLFRTPSLRRRTFIFFLYWFVNGLVYYGISQNADIFGSNYYLNFFLFGIVELPAYVIFSFVLKRCGRKWPAGLTMGFAGVFCVCAGVTPKSMHWLLVTLTVLGKFCIASSFALAYPYTSEAFPTAVRSIGLGSCSTCARISATVAPFAKELGEVIGLAWVMAIFGGFGILSGSLVYWLPETNGKVLSDTLLQGEKMDKEDQKKIAYS